MKVEQIYTGCLAQGAYYIESNGEVAIIDPLREVEDYIKKAAKEGAKIKYVFETHFHADFVSGHLDLAKKTGASIIFGPNAKPDFTVHSARDMEVFELGGISIQALHTPGHTLESTTYLLKDENGKDYCIFTGDTLFIGDVGRPDLAVKSNLTSEDLAGLLYDSLQSKIVPLADDVIVYPAHGAGSACGKNMAKETWDTLGHQKETNYALRKGLSREQFIAEVTDGQSPPPHYFFKNVMMNKGGYESLDTILKRGVHALNPDRFEMAANAELALILDTRSNVLFGKAHVPNSIFIGIDGQFAPWVGALIKDITQPILFVCDPGREEEVVTRLSRVGYDNTIGYLEGGIEAWINAGKEVSTIENISAVELGERYKKGTVHILDVRKPGEYESAHLMGAENVPLDFINEEMHKISNAETQYVHCAGGYRSMIFVSILQARGFDNLINVEGGWSEISKLGLPLGELEKH